MGALTTRKDQKMPKPKIPDFDAHAVVVDDHTGKVIANFQGLGAEADAKQHARICAQGGVDHMSSTSIIIGDAAKKAHKAGRV